MVNSLGPWRAENCVKSTYGFNDGARLMPSATQRARTFRWFLEKVEDPFGNQMIYKYQSDAGFLGGADPFVQIYPQEIDYTSNPAAGLAAAYSVKFGLGPRAATAIASPFLGEHRHGAVEANLEHFVRRRQVGVGPVVLHVRSVAADAGEDRLALLRLAAYATILLRQKIHGEVDALEVAARNPETLCGF